MGHGEAIAIGLQDLSLSTLLGAKLVHSDAGTVYDLGIRAAYAASHWVGVLFDGGIGVDDFGSNKDRVRWRSAASLGLDWGQKNSIPLGVMVKGEISQFTAAQTLQYDLNRDVMLGLFYTGREDIQLGLETTWGSVPLRDLNATLELTTVLFTLRYFF